MVTKQTAEFAKWFESLRDHRAQRKIAIRISRAESGNMGQVRSLGEGLSEMKIDHGPGYRLYFTMRDQEIVVLLAGGDKGSQQRDIAVARALAAGI